MAAQLIDGKALAQQVRDRLAQESAELLAKKSVVPGLATILVGDDPASHVYVKNKQKACEMAGIYVDDHKLPASTSQADLLALIEKEYGSQDSWHPGSVTLAQTYRQQSGSRSCFSVEGCGRVSSLQLRSTGRGPSRV